MFPKIKFRGRVKQKTVPQTAPRGNNAADFFLGRRSPTSVCRWIKEETSGPVLSWFTLTSIINSPEPGLPDGPQVPREKKKFVFTGTCTNTSPSLSAPSAGLVFIFVLSFIDSRDVTGAWWNAGISISLKFFEIWFKLEYFLASFCSFLGSKVNRGEEEELVTVIDGSRCWIVTVGHLLRACPDGRGGGDENGIIRRRNFAAWGKSSNRRRNQWQVSLRLFLHLFVVAASNSDNVKQNLSYQNPLSLTFTKRFSIDCSSVDWNWIWLICTPFDSPWTELSKVFWFHLHTINRLQVNCI